jgi:hypothetical protein
MGWTAVEAQDTLGRKEETEVQIGFTKDLKVIANV